MVLFQVHSGLGLARRQGGDLESGKGNAVIEIKAAHFGSHLEGDHAGIQDMGGELELDPELLELDGHRLHSR